MASKKNVMKKKALLGKTLPYIKKEYKLVLLTFILTILTAVLSASTPFITKSILDKFLPASDYDMVIKMLILYGGIVIVLFIVRYLFQFVNNLTGMRIEKRIREDEKNAIKEAAERTGARKVFLEVEPKVAAIGAGMDISKPSGNMVIDVGGGTTDIAILSLGGIVTSSSIKIAGNVFDSDIVKYIKEKYKLLVGERTAEDIKFSIGSVFPGSRNEQMEVKGRDLVTGLPHTITLTSDEIEEALRESVYAIIHAAKNVLEQTPPELAADIIDKGIVVTGGGALIHGFDELLSHELKVPVFIAESPLTCVVEGTGVLLDNIHLIGK